MLSAMQILDVRRWDAGAGVVCVSQQERLTCSPGSDSDRATLENHALQEGFV